MRFEVSWKIRRRSEAQPAAFSVRKLLCMWWQKNRSRSAKKNTHDKQKCFSGRNLWTHEGTVSERKCSVAWWHAAADENEPRNVFRREILLLKTPLSEKIARNSLSEDRFVAERIREK
ncbi:hypothetical protein T4D_6633 [Trichinella pseudospiralis]|uniref:Uncharacterized protein n=1 Tax=Trichinella pseudospiralis TaxID=6337 RepID=A0A0V1F404_TRIPS|nr:hypothetical protein T4D_6633 [Trichinella pseudospiralis]